MKHPCGCRSSDSGWEELCPPHAAEFAARHQRAQREKDCAELLGCYYLVPDESSGPTENEVVRCAAS